MIYEISGNPIPGHLAYAGKIQSHCVSANFPPCVAYAIAWRESIRGELNGSWKSAEDVLSEDGGHGIFQLTSSWPEDWTDVDANIGYALSHFLVPSLHFFAGTGVRGDGLVRCVAAAFNEGQGTAFLDHLVGNVDLGTTGHNYASEVLANYHRLIAGEDPT